MTLAEYLVPRKHRGNCRIDTRQLIFTSRIPRCANGCNRASVREAVSQAAIDKGIATAKAALPAWLL
jgi:hypothetical protein